MRNGFCGVVQSGLICARNDTPKTSNMTRMPKRGIMRWKVIGSLIPVQPAPDSAAADTRNRKKNRGPGISPKAAPFKLFEFRRADRLAANIRPALPASDDRQIPDAQCAVALTCSSVTQQSVLLP